MRIAILYLALMLLLVSPIFADDTKVVSCHLSFDDLDFLPYDWIEQTQLKTIEERKWELVTGRFGKALYIGAVPLKYVGSNLTGMDCDMVSGIIFNLGSSQKERRSGYNEPFLWGAGKIHPGCGAVAFWVKASSKPQDPNAKTILFEQTTTSWGRLERQLMELELLPDGTITAYVEDARYVQHSIKTPKVWDDSRWNHVVFMWDRTLGLSLWVNGKKAASSMGTDAWWENQRPGLFHLPTIKAVYDEFYAFNRPLTEKEISQLYENNTIPTATGQPAFSAADIERLKQAFISDTSRLPLAKPSGDALVFREITPERIHDEGITGWWISDGRYELAWPHEYSIFTIIPGDVDFHAEKADILPPPAEQVNYITFEGNLDGVKVLKGDRKGNFESVPVVTIPKTDAFFHGTTVQNLGDAELRIPFTKTYGPPPGFESDGDVLRLPLSADLRLHEVGLFNVYEDSLDALPGDIRFHVGASPISLADSRYPVALKAMFIKRDRHVSGLYNTSDHGSADSLEVAPMTRLHLITEPMAWKFACKTIILDMWVTSPAEENILQLKLHDAAVPSHTWTHAEMKLIGFGKKPSLLRVALEFDPMFLVSGDRIWLELLATDGLSIITGDPEHPSTVTIRPETDWLRAEQKFAIKTLRPCIMTYGRSFEYIPWQADKRMPDVDAPKNFGGMFDMAYPWQAVLKVIPGDRTANIYKTYTTPELKHNTYGKNPEDMDDLPDRKSDSPANAPDWAIHQRQFQDFRQRIVTWWRHHQRSDGQVGGGWNDDTLIFSGPFGDLPLDSNPDALALYNNVYDGFDKTNYYKDGYCRITPMDAMHNGDLIRERYKSIIYNLGDPRSATWAMAEAWHWEKPDQTPINYGDGKAFRFGITVLQWYWGKARIGHPYQANREALIETLRKAALLSDDTTLWRFTEAWVHTDDQWPYGSHRMADILLGGLGNLSRSEGTGPISVGIGWIEGGGPQLARLVELSGNDRLKVSMYSFDQLDRKVVARLFRLSAGRYKISLRSDRDNNGTYENIVSERQEHFRRFASLNLMVPPKVPVLLEITQLQADPDPGPLPDLATSDYYVRKQGDSLVVTVHNIGCAPSGAFSVSLLDSQGRILKTKMMDSLPAATDFVPKTVDVTFSDFPDCARYQIQIDKEDKIKEIFEENNSISITAAHNGWRDLIAEDLSNCVYRPNGWTMTNGVLCPNGNGDIWTKEKFGDFILDLEFKPAKNANSGIFLRIGPDVILDDGHLAGGIEVQILDSYGLPDVPKEKRTDRSLGAGLVFIGSPGHAYLAPTRNAVNKPNHWNHYTITLKGSKLYVVLNGEQVNSMDLYWWAQGHDNPDYGNFPKKYKAEDMPRKGHIGLQYHGQPIVCYRNLKIKQL